MNVYLNYEYGAIVVAESPHEAARMLRSWVNVNIEWVDMTELNTTYSHVVMINEEEQ